MNIPLKENERLDDLQNGYHIIQNTRDFLLWYRCGAAV